jgi:hypothetical protein
MDQQQRERLNEDLYCNVREETRKLSYETTNIIINVNERMDE